MKRVGVEFINSLKDLIDPERILVDEPMCNHTTFRIGGPADVMVIPESVEEIAEVVKWTKKNDIPYLVVGGGSNLLVRDGGIRGVVIKLDDHFSSLEVGGEQVTAQSGIKIGRLVRELADQGLSGLEFAEGIPGNLGGAVYMNAGAYGGEFSQVVRSVTVLEPNGNVCEHGFDDLRFGYRSTSLQTSNSIVLTVSLSLRRDEKANILRRINEFAQRRQEKQPLELPSAGSMFKRPPERFVGPMIEELGLKGCRIGDAEISRKHAGFVVNCGKATSADVLALIEYVTVKVLAEYGVRLETEPLIVGED